MDSNQILHTSKDHQICFVGGPETQKTNPKWQTAAIFKNQKNHDISVTIWPILTKFGMVMQLGPLDDAAH